MQLTRWGPEPSLSAPPIFLLHGWQDTSDTFQFMVDQFARDWPIVALDWRGFGRSEWPQEGYWFSDYFADLEALLELLSPDAPARLVGHSMGGNVAGIYAGLRPERVHCVASLEGFGLPQASADRAPHQLRQWLDQVKSPPSRKEYESLEQFIAVVQFRYPRFSAPQAAFVAAAWCEPQGDRVRLLGDPRHRRINPVRYHRDDAEACWRAVKAPFLMVLGDESDYLAKFGKDGQETAIRSIIPHIDIARIAGAGHMLHIERADLVAPLVERFLSEH
jgi:pimeloyl-ACP methyl ester carboxylesterase